MSPGIPSWVPLKIPVGMSPRISSGIPPKILAGFFSVIQNIIILRIPVIIHVKILSWVRPNIPLNGFPKYLPIVLPRILTRILSKISSKIFQGVPSEISFYFPPGIQ